MLTQGSEFYLAMHVEPFPAGDGFFVVIKEEQRMVVRMEHVHFSYGQKVILNGLNLHVETGEFVSIVGASGCGKSTVFRLLLGLEKPQQGRIKKHGKIGYMPQHHQLMPWRTALDNAIVPLECQGVKKAKARTQAQQLFTRFGLAGYEDKKPYELSGGMQQRVSLIRALLTGADVLLLDEPFSALDALTRNDLQKWLKDIVHLEQKTVIFITHDIEEALFLSDRIFVATKKPLTAFECMDSAVSKAYIYEKIGGAIR